MTSSPSTPPPLPTTTKFVYGLGSLAYGIKDVAFRTYLLLYYNVVLGVPATVVSSAIMVAMIVDAVSDPVVGQFSDHLKTKWGRRHPLMYASAIPAAISFLFLWFPPEGLGNGQMFLYLVLVSSAVRTFITLYEIPSSALAPELATGYDDRTSIASFRYFFGYIGYFGMSFLALFFFFAETPEYPVGQLNPQGYILLGTLGAGIMFTTVMISTIGTHHRIPYLSAPPDTPRPGLFDTLRHMRTTFSHKGFLSILAFGMLKYTAIGVAAALVLYFYTFFFGLKSKELALLTIDGMLAALLALWVAPYLSKTYGKKNAAIVLAIASVFFAAMPYVLRLTGLFWPNGHPMLLPTLFVIQCFYYTCGVASAVLVHAMIGDVVDEKALETGKRSEGLFYAANSFMQKSVSGLGVVVAGFLLTLAQFPDGARPGEVPQSAINTLVLLYVPTLAILYILGASFLRHFKIDRAQHEANLEKLRVREAPLLAEEDEASAGVGVPPTRMPPAPSPGE